MNIVLPVKEIEVVEEEECGIADATGRLLSIEEIVLALNAPLPELGARSISQIVDEAASAPTMAELEQHGATPRTDALRNREDLGADDLLHTTLNSHEELERELAKARIEIANRAHFEEGYRQQVAAARSTSGTIPEEVARQQESLMHPATQVFFRAGLLACREYMARFVEAQDPAIAQSIRANWWPSLGKDYGPPRRIDFKELTEGEFGEDGFRVKAAAEVSPTIEALPVALQFLQSIEPGAVALSASGTLPK